MRLEDMEKAKAGRWVKNGEGRDIHIADSQAEAAIAGYEQRNVLSVFAMFIYLIGGLLTLLPLFFPPIGYLLFLSLAIGLLALPSLLNITLLPECVGAVKNNYGRSIHGVFLGGSITAGLVMASTKDAGSTFHTILLIVFALTSISVMLTKHAALGRKHLPLRAYSFTIVGTLIAYFVLTNFIELRQNFAMMEARQYTFKMSTFFSVFALQLVALYLGACVWEMRQASAAFKEYAMGVGTYLESQGIKSTRPNIDAALVEIGDRNDAAFKEICDKHWTNLSLAKKIKRGNSLFLRKFDNFAMILVVGCVFVYLASYFPSMMIGYAESAREGIEDGHDTPQDGQAVMDDFIKKV